MQTLEGTHIRLRALEPEDLSFLASVENNEQFWEISHTQSPFSMYLLKQYLANSAMDIYEAKQLRLVIEQKEQQQAVGMIDLFDFNPKHLRAGIGILIHPLHQKNGFASEALELTIRYSIQHLHLHQLYASMTTDNKKSMALFEKHGFERTGTKKDWIRTTDGFKDEHTYQFLATHI